MLKNCVCGGVNIYSYLNLKSRTAKEGRKSICWHTKMAWIWKEKEIQLRRKLPDLVAGTFPACSCTTWPVTVRDTTPCWWTWHGSVIVTFELRVWVLCMTHLPMVLHNAIKFDRNPSEVMAVTQSEWMDMNEASSTGLSLQVSIWPETNNAVDA